MKSIIIICALLLSFTLLRAQSEQKKTTVRVKKVEIINGVEKVSDTTYTTDLDRLPEIPGLPEKAELIDIPGKDGNIQKLVIIDNGNSGEAEGLHEGLKKERRVVVFDEHNKAGNIEEVSEIKIEGVALNKEQLERLGKLNSELNEVELKRLHEAVLSMEQTLNNINAETKDGQTIIIKKATCGSGKEQLEKSPVVCIATVTRKIKLSDLNEEDKKRLSGKALTASDDLLSAEEMKFYPNPSDGKFNLNFTLAKKGHTELNIFDIEGRTVYSEKLGEFSGTYNKQIDISKEPKGVYFIKISQDQHSQLKKIVLD